MFCFNFTAAISTHAANKSLDHITHGNISTKSVMHCTHLITAKVILEKTNSRTKRPNNYYQSSNSILNTEAKAKA